jgi:hypothetical protein
MSSHLVTKPHHAAFIGFDLRQMEEDVSVELLKKRYSIANQDRQDRITNFIGQPETEAFARNYTTSNKPDGTKRGPQVSIHELHKIACAELDGIPGPRQIATSEDERGFVAVRPTEPFGFETQRGLIGFETP